MKKKDHHQTVGITTKKIKKKNIRAISITNQAVTKALTIVSIMKKRKKNPAMVAAIS